MKLFLMIAAVVFGLYFLKEHLAKRLNGKKPKTVIPQKVAPQESDPQQVNSPPDKAILDSNSVDEAYDIDWDLITCTCPDFKKRRERFPKGDLRRLCKHVLACVHPPDDDNYFDLIMYLQSVEKGFPFGKSFYKVIKGQKVTAFIDEERKQPWINVFTDQDRYGYHIHDKTWSYGEEPRKPELIAKWLTECWDSKGK